MKSYNHHNLEKARQLRKEMTIWERKLWFTFLRHYPIRFYRQIRIENYIVDFYCAGVKLVIEIDGRQHYNEEGRASDKIRDEFLTGLGINVVRYTNRQIRDNFVGVCKDIEKRIFDTSSTASGPPSPQGEG